MKAFAESRRLIGLRKALGDNKFSPLKLILKDWIKETEGRIIAEAVRTEIIARHVQARNARALLAGATVDR